MDALLEQLKKGEFIIDSYTIILKKSRIKIWTDPTWMNYSFYPRVGVSFTWKEKLQIRKAIKEGMLKQIQ